MDETPEGTTNQLDTGCTPATPTPAAPQPPVDSSGCCCAAGRWSGQRRFSVLTGRCVPCPRTTWTLPSPPSVPRAARPPCPDHTGRHPPPHSRSPHPACAILDPRRHVARRVRIVAECAGLENRDGGGARTWGWA